jgi:hypothetical protein
LASGVSARAKKMFDMHAKHAIIPQSAPHKEQKMKSVKIESLQARVVVKTEKRGMKKIYLSNVYVYLRTSEGVRGVASGTLVGNYNEEQALKEF